MLGIQVAFVATTGTALDTVERGGKPRHSLRAAIRMPKPNKEADYGTQWVTLNIREFGADFARNIKVGTQVFVTGKMRVTPSTKGGDPFFDVDVDDISTALPPKEKTDDAGPSW